MAGEKIIHTTRLHPSVLSRSAAFFAAAILLLVLPHFFPAFHWLAWLCPLPLVFCLRDFLDYISSEFVITNQRLLLKAGWTKTETRQTLLNKLGRISVAQSLGGRFFGYGTVTIMGPGSAVENLTMLRNPVRFSREIQQQMVAGDSKPEPAPQLALRSVSSQDAVPSIVAQELGQDDEPSSDETTGRAARLLKHLGF